MTEGTTRKIWIAFFLLMSIIANGPLLYIIWLHDLKTVQSIVGHAPNQFLFMLIFFPAAILTTIKSFEETMKIASDHETIKETRFWNVIIKKQALVVSAVIIALSFAAVDHKFTPPDFYQLEPELAKRAATLNRNIIVAIAETTEEKESRETHSEIIAGNRQALLEMYQSQSRVDKKMMVLEFLELTTAGIMVSIIMWTGFLNLKIMRYASSNLVPEDETQALKKRLILTIPYSVATVLIYLFWPPFRLYNIYEIRKICVDYQTIDPTFGYIIAAIFSIAMCWLYYNKTNPQFFKVLTAIITFFASGALMGFVKLKPESLIGVIGSGMGPANLFAFLFVVGLAYLFGSEILQQMRGKI